MLSSELSIYTYLWDDQIFGERALIRVFSVTTPCMHINVNCFSQIKELVQDIAIILCLQCVRSVGLRNRYCAETGRATTPGRPGFESCIGRGAVWGGISQSAGTCNARSNFTAPISRERLNRIWRRHRGQPALPTAAADELARDTAAVARLRAEQDGRPAADYDLIQRPVRRSNLMDRYFSVGCRSTYLTSSGRLGAQTVAMVVVLLCRLVLFAFSLRCRRWHVITVSASLDYRLPTHHADRHTAVQHISCSC